MIKELIELLNNFGLGFVVGGGIIWLIFKIFIPSYLTEKGKNLATKEDIGKITETVESVKAGYAEIIEEIKSNHQLKLTAIQREKEIKKEVYMEAAEAITRSQNMLASFSNLNLSEESLTAAFVADAGKISKVQIVGNSKTVKAVTNFMSAIGTSTLNLMLERSSLMQRKISIEIAQKYRDKSHGEVERYVELMKNLNLEGNKNPQIWDTIKKGIEFEKNRCDKYQSNIDELWIEQNREHLAFSKKCMDEFFEISELLPDVILAVREELDMHISSEDYLDIYNENIVRGKTAFYQFIQKIQTNQA